MSAYAYTRYGAGPTYWHLIHRSPGTETSPMGHQQLCHLHLKHKKPTFLQLGFRSLGGRQQAHVLAAVFCLFCFVCNAWD